MRPKRPNPSHRKWSAGVPTFSIGRRRAGFHRPFRAHHGWIGAVMSCAENKNTLKRWGPTEGWRVCRDSSRSHTNTKFHSSKTVLSRLYSGPTLQASRTIRPTVTGHLHSDIHVPKNRLGTTENTAIIGRNYRSTGSC